MSLSWSHKYRELLSQFGMESNVVEFEDMDADILISIFERAWSERLKQKAVIPEKRKDLKSKIDTLFDEVAKIIQRDNNEARNA